MSLSVFYIEYWVFSMLHLPSLIGATPETRLVLLAWVAFHQCSGGATTVVPFEGLGLSKRQLSTALAYLVRTEFVWKIRNFSSQFKGGRSRDRFDYGLSTKYFEETRGTLINCLWWTSEVLYVLTCLNLTNKVIDGKSVLINPAMRLVWAVLVSHADRAGYVTGLDNLSLSKMTGMDGKRLKTTLQLLQNAGCISIKTTGAPRTSISDSIAPIYKIIPHNLVQKDILVGVTTVDDLSLRSEFLYKLNVYYDRVCKLESAENKRGKKKANTGLHHTPKYNDRLDELDCQLSKTICKNKLILPIYHLNLSIILDHIASFAHARYVNSTETMPIERALELREVLNRQVRQKLIRVIMSSVVDLASTESGLSDLQEYLIDTLTREITWIIHELAKAWVPLLSFFSAEVQPVAFKEQYMALINPKESENSNDNEKPSDANLLLKVRVPNNSLFTNCLVDGSIIWTDNSRVTGQKVRYGERLFLSEESRIKYNPASD
jgi:hypothetical protein